MATTYMLLLLLAAGAGHGTHEAKGEGADTMAEGSQIPHKGIEKKRGSREPCF